LKKNLGVGKKIQSVHLDLLNATCWIAMENWFRHTTFLQVRLDPLILKHVG